MLRQIVLTLSSFIMSCAICGSAFDNKKPILDLSKEELVTIDDTTVWQLRDRSLIYFKSGFQIDADGSPDAYHPDDIGTDSLIHAKDNNENWVGIVTLNGKPVVQGKNDPCPGYYISQTSLFDESKKLSDPNRFVNSKAISYFVLPKSVMKKGNIRLGDIGLVVNWNNRYAYYAILADIGSSNKLGEGSIALAKKLNIPSDPKIGGINDSVFYFVFPQSGTAKPLSLSEIKKRCKKELEQIGGLNTLVQIIKAEL